MDVKKLSNLMMIIGGAIILAACVWWFSFYGKITKEVDAQLSEAFKCIYSSGGLCGFCNGMASFAGYTPYNPLVFWIGVVLLGIGIILSVSAD